MPLKYRENAPGTPHAAFSILIDSSRVNSVSRAASFAGMSVLNNLVIADLLRGVQDEQEKAYRAYEKALASSPTAVAPPRVLIIIEEAHEFLSAERVDRMQILFEQVAKKEMA